jgi:hypothetical protein
MAGQRVEVTGVDNGPAANAPVHLTPVYDESGILVGYTEQPAKPEKRPVLTLKKGKAK